MILFILYNDKIKTIYFQTSVAKYFSPSRMKASKRYYDSLTLATNTIDTRIDKCTDRLSPQTDDRNIAWNLKRKVTSLKMTIKRSCMSTWLEKKRYDEFRWAVAASYKCPNKETKEPWKYWRISWIKKKRFRIDINENRQ